MKKAPQAQAWRLSGKTFRPHTFTELQLEDSSNGFKNVSNVNPYYVIGISLHSFTSSMAPRVRSPFSQRHDPHGRVAHLLEEAVEERSTP
jgi:hypothetical protein